MTDADETLAFTAATFETLIFEDVNPETLRLMVGLDPGQDGGGEPVFAVTADSIVCPFVAPRKRKGLTGKRYRIARRRYRREMQAWRRGEVPGIYLRHHVPRAIFNVAEGTITAAPLKSPDWWTL